MTITVNGERRDVSAGITVAQLLESLSVNPQLVAVELNLDILSRAQYREAALKEGDTVEVVQMVGGG